MVAKAIRPTWCEVSFLIPLDSRHSRMAASMRDTERVPMGDGRRTDELDDGPIDGIEQTPPKIGCSRTETVGTGL
jgi:hypothetical protein